jgi:hypothetical protein
MWAIEDLETANPDKGTFLEHLLRIGATSEEVLAHTADSLEQRTGPVVAVFGQLPFVIRAPNRVFHSPGWRSGVSVELSFLPGAGAVSPEGEFRQLGAIPEQERIGPADELQFTQVVGFIRLWNKRGRLYAAYRKCLTGRGIRNETIGRIEDWMDLSEAKMPLPSRRYAPLTAAAFENEIARRMHTEFVRALHVFVRAYSVANLEMLPPTPKVYGYFAMVAPGRIASAAHPEPIVAGLSQSLTVQLSAMPDLDKVESLLSKALPHQDRVLRS